jgi:hypothetical protein
MTGSAVHDALREQQRAGILETLVKQTIEILEVVLTRRKRRSEHDAGLLTNASGRKTTTLHGLDRRNERDLRKPRHATNQPWVSVVIDIKIDTRE